VNPQNTFTSDPDGQRHERWQEIKVTREIDRMRTDFNIAVWEHHLASARVTGSKSGAGPPPPRGRGERSGFRLATECG
jgi:hypothetical protein